MPCWRPRSSACASLSMSILGTLLVGYSLIALSFLSNWTAVTPAALKAPAWRHRPLAYSVAHRAGLSHRHLLWPSEVQRAILRTPRQRRPVPRSQARGFSGWLLSISTWCGARSPGMSQPSDAPTSVAASRRRCVGTHLQPRFLGAIPLRADNTWRPIPAPLRPVRQQDQGCLARRELRPSISSNHTRR